MTGSIIEKIKEEQVMVLDLLNTLTYMSSIATADITRDKIFELTSQQDGITPKYIRKIYLLVKNYGYEYTRACKIVAEEARHPALKDFLTRLANALSTGEDEEEFLSSEVDRLVEVYTNKYERDIETLKKWTDGYSAILVSITLVIAVFLISSMLFQIGDLYLTSFLSGVLLCFVAFFGVYVIYRVAPYEKIVHSLKIRSKEQEMARKLSIFTLPAACVVSVSLLMLRAEHWMIFLALSAFLAPVGIVGMIDSKNIEKADEDISPFLKSLGSTAGTTGTTLTKALEKLDKKAVGSLEEKVRRLYKRLRSEVDPKICWYNFIGETGSELINRSTRVFLDAIDLGGDPTKIGETVSKSSLGISLLRAKRKLVSKGFMNLLIPLHASMCGVLIFIYRVMFSFNNAIAEMVKKHLTEVGGAAGNLPPGMSFFGFGSSSIDMEYIANFVSFVVLVLTFANAFASKFAAGGSNYKLCYYLSVMFFLSAIMVLVVPMIADKVFALH
ncbi:MAG: archaellar assembly protein FlaJ [Candidatus Methanospirareceae archaeon]